MSTRSTAEIAVTRIDDDQGPSPSKSTDRVHHAGVAESKEAIKLPTYRMDVQQIMSECGIPNQEVAEYILREFNYDVSAAVKGYLQDTKYWNDRAAKSRRSSSSSPSCEQNVLLNDDEVEFEAVLSRKLVDGRWKVFVRWGGDKPDGWLFASEIPYGIDEFLHLIPLHPNMEHITIDMIEERLAKYPNPQLSNTASQRSFSSMPSAAAQSLAAQQLPSESSALAPLCPIPTRSLSPITTPPSATTTPVPVGSPQPQPQPSMSMFMPSDVRMSNDTQMRTPSRYNNARTMTMTSPGPEFRSSSGSPPTVNTQHNNENNQAVVQSRSPPPNYMMQRTTSPSMQPLPQHGHPTVSLSSSTSVPVAALSSMITKNVVPSSEPQVQDTKTPPISMSMSMSTPMTPMTMRSMTPTTTMTTITTVTTMTKEMPDVELDEMLEDHVIGRKLDYLCSRFCKGDEAAKLRAEAAALTKSLHDLQLQLKSSTIVTTD